MRGIFVRLYPRAWRQRYGAKFEALIEQQPLNLVSILDVLRGALDAHRMAWRQRRASVAQVQLEQGRKHAMKRRRHPSSCSFCGKPHNTVRRLIAGPDVCICNECITLCNEIIATYEHLPPPGPTQNQGSAARRRKILWWQRLFGQRYQTLLQRSRSPEPRFQG